jgi:hypothetical protein
LVQAEYIPLPPSPPTWEVDGRNEFHREYNDPLIGPVFQAGFKNQYAKVVKLAVGLSLKQRQGRVGEVIAKSYSNLIIQRMKDGQLTAAAKQCVEMFESVPHHITDVDRRRFNRILAQMDKEGRSMITHLLMLPGRHHYRCLRCRKTPLGHLCTTKTTGNERPDPAFNIAPSIRRVFGYLTVPVPVWDGRSKKCASPVDQRGFLIAEKALFHDTIALAQGALVPASLLWIPVEIFMSMTHG